MLTELCLASMLLTTSPASTPIVTDAVFIEEYDHEDLSFLKGTSVSILGDSISTWKGISIEGGSEAVYPDSTITDFSQMWYSDLTQSNVSAVGGSYVTNREEGEYVNFNSNTRIEHIGDASWCIIYGGTCDLLADVSAQTFESGLRSLVSNVQYGGMRNTVLCTLPPIKHENQYGEDYTDFNDIIRTVAKDTGSKLAEFEDAWKLSEIDTYTEDGVHPNVAGMSKLKERFT